MPDDQLHPSDDMRPASLLRRVRNYDRQRAGVPGEHWMTAAAGAWLLRAAARRRSVAGGLLFAAAGIALLVRAASGRDGLAALRQRI